MHFKSFMIHERGARQQSSSFGSRPMLTGATRTHNSCEYDANGCWTKIASLGQNCSVKVQLPSPRDKHHDQTLGMSAIDLRFETAIPILTTRSSDVFPATCVVLYLSAAMPHCDTDLPARPPLPRRGWWCTAACPTTHAAGEGAASDGNHKTRTLCVLMMRRAHQLPATAPQ